VCVYHAPGEEKDEARQVGAESVDAPAKERLQPNYGWFTVVLLWCHRGVTVVLQWCYSGVTGVLRWCHSGWR
jgi:hypothetical protein